MSDVQDRVRKVRERIAREGLINVVNPPRTPAPKTLGELLADETREPTKERTR